MNRTKRTLGWRLLTFGKLNWYLLLNPEECVEVIKAVKPEVLLKRCIRGTSLSLEGVGQKMESTSLRSLKRLSHTLP